MSFRCEGPSCETTKVGPRIKPTLMVVATRATAHETRKRGEDGRLFPCIVMGDEIASEIKLCPTCAGLPEPRVVAPSEEMLLRKVQVRGPMPGGKVKDHRRGCKDPLIECFMCRKYIEAARTLPLPVLSEILEQPQPSTLRASMLRVVLEGVARRSDHTTKRAAHDLQAAYTILAPYDRAKGGKAH